MMDKETFCAGIVDCQETMFRAAKAILQNDQDAEDAVQEAICTAFARRDSLREMDKFRPWVLRILTNKCYDACRKRRNTVDLEAAGEVPAATGLDTAERLSLWQAVMSLSDDLRATVTLFYYDGMSVREISGILGISEAAVKTRLRRGRERLRLLLDEK
ncbi:MAG: sigma-70 family RNA polymerase sigma factor [Oscillospiraceae bacterium]|nr:sigma-70 family RNA polymerase sigma factor [Oscillospiraceae bacterium]